MGELAPCGTWSAYRRHLRHGEVADQECRDAAAAATREWRDRERPPRYRLRKGEPKVALGNRTVSRSTAERLRSEAASTRRSISDIVEEALLLRWAVHP